MIKKFVVSQIAFLDKASLLNVSRNHISTNCYSYSGLLTSGKQELRPYCQRFACKGKLHCLVYRGKFTFGEDKKQNRETEQKSQLQQKT